MIKPDPVNHAIAMLSEHWDTVQIVCTRHTLRDGTTMRTEGTGNWHARVGSCRRWVNRVENLDQAEDTHDVTQED